MKIRLFTRPLAAVLTLAVASSLFVSCASGPTYAEVKDKLPPIPSGKGRVFVYRPSAFGAAVRPKVKMDSQVVGTSRGKGFFYTDQNAGTHEISIATEWKHKNKVTVVSGQPSFVECKVTVGLVAGHIIPNQVDKSTGESKIQGCKMPAE